MRICVIHGVVIRMHPLFPLLIFLYILAGQGMMIAAFLLALLLHESGHFYAAQRLNLPVSQIELTPFGGAMQIDLSRGLERLPALWLASAGILMNCLCAAFSFGLVCASGSGGFWAMFTAANLMMLFVNLIPILPLDGGRMLLSVLTFFVDRALAFSVLLWLGRFLAVALVAYAGLLSLQGAFRLHWILLGSFLLYASALEEQHSVSRYLSALFAARKKAESGVILQVQCIAAPSTKSLCSLFPQLKPNCYHIVAVTDPDSGRIRHFLYENQLLDAALHSPSAPLTHLIPFSNKNKPDI